ncbi:MAG TPA: aldehyde dehydrogenase family protein [Trebonia sp.]|nr:aldehyde dehydrogenase family protein [Trebonia sp.]
MRAVGTSPVPSAVSADVDHAVRAARRAFDDGQWTTSAPAQHAAALERLAAAIEARTEDAARAVTTEPRDPEAPHREGAGNTRIVSVFNSCYGTSI